MPTAATVPHESANRCTCIPTIRRAEQSESIRVCKTGSVNLLSFKQQALEESYEIPTSRLHQNGWILDTESRYQAFLKIKLHGINLLEYVNNKLFYGLKTGLNQAFQIDELFYSHMVRQCPESRDLIKKFLGGQDIKRYCIASNLRYLIVIPSGWTAKKSQISHPSEAQAWDWFYKNYTILARHLETFRDEAKRRQDQGQFWWELRACDYYDYLDRPKIVYPDIAKFPRFYLDSQGTYITNTAYCLGTDDRYLLGILNSKLFWFAISCISIPFGTRAGEFRYRLIYQYMEKVPIRAAIPNSKL